MIAPCYSQNTIKLFPSAYYILPFYKIPYLSVYHYLVRPSTRWTSPSSKTTRTTICWSRKTASLYIISKPRCVPRSTHTPLSRRLGRVGRERTRTSKRWRTSKYIDCIAVLSLSMATISCHTSTTSGHRESRKLLSLSTSCSMKCISKI